MHQRVAKFAVSVIILFSAIAAVSQSQAPYGPPIGVETAKHVAAVAIGEAHKNGWTMAVAVVDPGGNLVYYEKMDNTQLGSAKVAVDKARSAALFKRPTKAFADRVAAGGAGLGALAIEGAVPVEGGVPLVIEGKIVGAIGLSGDTSEHDGVCAQAGADSLR
jgi:glc operon protein GlcG